MQKRRPDSTSEYPIKDNTNPPTIKKFESRPSLLFNWDDFPHSLRDNEYIHTSYYLQSNSYLASISSLKYLHNQTGNIYTQIFSPPIILLSSLSLVYFPVSSFPTPDAEDIFVFDYFFTSLLAATGMSEVFHTIYNHSPQVLDKALSLDFFGVARCVKLGFCGNGFGMLFIIYLEVLGCT
jgi:adiponectin receptor